jgi:hypothetical protein
VTADQRITCPTCHRQIDWPQAPFRPFCSERCKLIDLGAWLTEKHAIPGEPAPAEAVGRAGGHEDGDPPPDRRPA